SVKSILTQSALDALWEKFYIPDVVHPELPGHNDRIHNIPTYILGYFQINLSQLSVIAAAKVSHFEILCRVNGFVPSVGIDIMADSEIQAIVANQPKRVRKKRKTADGASGSGFPPKKLKEDHGASGDVGADDEVTSIVRSSMPPLPVLTAAVTTTTTTGATFTLVCELGTRQDNWLKERDAEISNLKAQLSLKEAEVAKAIRLWG
nr:transposase (putative), gypsy type [Tanacetum cinerariifolium]